MARSISLIAGAVCVLSLSRVAQAQGGTTVFYQGQGGGQAPAPTQDAPGARIDALALRGIPLADAQKDSLRSLGVANRDAARRIIEAHAGGTLDSSAQAELKTLRQQYLQQVRGVLTSGQQKAYDNNLTNVENRIRAAANPYGGNAAPVFTPGPTVVPVAPAASGLPGTTPVPPTPATSGGTPPGPTPTPVTPFTPPTPVTPVSPNGPS